MRPRKIAIAIAVAALAGALLLLASRRASPPTRSAVTPSSPAPLAAAPPAPDEARPIVPAAMPDAPTSAPPAASAPSATTTRAAARLGAPAATDWDEVPVAVRFSDLGALARPVMDGLNAARAQMDSCFEEEARAIARGEQPKYDPNDPPTGPAILVLDLESRAGALDVVQANVETMGTSTPQLVRCAQQVLRGWVIQAPPAGPGKRYRLKHLLQ